ncbi:DMT family transporter [Paracoccus sediminis]|uniref:DMT family transporter n=1 Tax=Paracoccus sediminis TaxID=1214787 RepID=A0A238UNG9_9RHOB|nr:DMT family transporter [Paracoccus sediminis]TBN53024.1 DMT family transporter [Paracoccus sediminis]SNR23605.1 Permease of the drug/metabolite transporter (DMT) superfamily [Paracoccus sediminis]
MRTPIMSPIRRMKPASVRYVPLRSGDNLRGALVMALSMVAFGLNDTVMKFVAQDLPLYQSITLRGVMVMVFIAAVAPRLGGLSLNIPAPARGPMAWRSLGEVASTVLFLNALQNMAMGDLSAIMQALPLVVMVAAALFFGETLGWRRISAVIFGFLGVLLILRPGGAVFGAWAVVALGAMAMVAVRDLATRGFDRHISSATIAFYAAAGVTLTGFLLSLVQGWVMPDLIQILLLATGAAILTVGYVTAVAAMRVGEISYVAPFRYTSLLVAILMGLLVFDEWPDLWTWAGSAMVVAAGIYTIWREAQLGKVR